MVERRLGAGAPGTNRGEISAIQRDAARTHLILGNEQLAPHYEALLDYTHTLSGIQNGLITPPAGADGRVWAQGIIAERHAIEPTVIHAYEQLATPNAIEAKARELFPTR